MSTSSANRPVPPPVASTGVAGIDSILHGGLPRGEMHLVQGIAGTGKTTIALQYLLEGAREGEAVLYVTLSQPKTHLERIAASHGWDLTGIEIFELSPGTVADRIMGRQTILPTSELALGELFRDLAEIVNRVKPRRAVIDSITIIQMLAGTAQRYHEEVVTLRQMFLEHDCTVIVLADHPAEADRGVDPEVIFHPLCGCVIHLHQDARPFGGARRRLRVVKARGIAQNSGYHDMVIRTGRTDVYPRLGAYEKSETPGGQVVSSNIETLDRMLDGGLETGTSCLIVGASGVGKSVLATVYATRMAELGARGAIYSFDERPAMYLRRADGLGLSTRKHVEEGTILLTQLDPGEIAPGEFAQNVRAQVDEHGIKVVIIDSIVGYFAAMGGADVLVTQLHELMTYLARSDVLLVLCGSQEGFMSIGVQDAVDVSYLSDTIIAITFFEAQGELRRAIAIVKKKVGNHDRAIHEFLITSGHINVVPERLEDPTQLFVGSGPYARHD